MADASLPPILLGTFAVIGIIAGAIVKYDDYNRKKTKQAREDEQAIIAAEAARLAAEELKWNAKIEAVRTEGNAALTALRTEFEGKIRDLTTQVETLTIEKRDHDHENKRLRQAMQTAVYNLKGTPNTEQVQRDLITAGRLPEDL